MVLSAEGAEQPPHAQSPANQRGLGRAHSWEDRAAYFLLSRDLLLCWCMKRMDCGLEPHSASLLWASLLTSLGLSFSITSAKHRLYVLEVFK